MQRNYSAKSCEAASKGARITCESWNVDRGGDRLARPYGNQMLYTKSPPAPQVAKPCKFLTDIHGRITLEHSIEPEAAREQWLELYTILPQIDVPYNFVTVNIVPLSTVGTYSATDHVGYTNCPNLLERSPYQQTPQRISLVNLERFRLDFLVNGTVEGVHYVEACTPNVVCAI